MKSFKSEILSQQEICAFRQLIWDHYATNRREFPWRYVEDPYYVVVSEIMLQQTQTYRVEPKFISFVQQFPTWQALVAASWPEVLLAWQGLGYNSRAKRLHDMARRICTEFNGSVPDDPAILETFSGIGPNTAGSICAFAFNKPTLFVETNIRAVFIFHFFPGKEKVHDKLIMPLAQATIDHADSRSWYYALMDYGVYLKQNARNPTRRSAHYTVQSKFEGSDRQIRSMILKILLARGPLKTEEILALIDREQVRVMRMIDDLCNEKLIVREQEHLMIV
jgi:A/G-specific adenine glycosylase